MWKIKVFFSKIWLQQLGGVAPVGVIVVLLERKGTTRVGRRSKKPSAFHRAFCVPMQGRLTTYVLLTEFLSFMYSTPLLSSVMD